ncbi:MAG: hypothetical protein A2Z18_05510 [Armatimonadetes bacterium RBG_16_58_9]|nr:MAG: hypothetical protein A2Z18_05510 [Armatimonadetes bacterium RBG_16_58_9]
MKFGALGLVVLVGIVSCSEALAGDRAVSGTAGSAIIAKNKRGGLFAGRPTWFGKYDERLSALVLPETARLRQIMPIRGIELDLPDGKWINGLPLGNGHIFTMMFGAPQALRFAFNKPDIWDERHRGPDNSSVLPGSYAAFKDALRRRGGQLDQRNPDPKDAALEEMARGFTGLGIGQAVEDRPSYQTCGVLELALLGGTEARRDHRLLSLAEAEVKVDYQDPDNSYQMRSFFAAQPPVLTVQWQGKLPADKGLRVALFRHPSLLVGSPTMGVDGNILWLDMNLPLGLRYVMMARLEGEGFHFRLETKPVPPLPYRIGASATSEEDFSGPPVPTIQACATHQKGGTVAFTLYLTIVSSNDSPDPFGAAKQILQRAQAADPEAICQTHRQWWNSFWQKSAVALPNEHMERAWYLGLYLLGCSSAIGATAPPSQAWHYLNLPVCTGRYHLDGDVMMYYWPIYSANHLELGEPYYRLFLDALPQVKQDTRRYYGCRGAKFPLAMSPCGKETGGHIQALWPGSSASVALNYWWHYLYSKDLRFLRGAAYPFFKECVLFYEDYLEREPSGRRRFFADYSPEHLVWGDNAAVDIALLKALYQAAIESSRVLNLDAEARSKWEDTLRNLPAYPQRNGYLIDLEGIEFTDRHCVLSHLTPIYPALDLSLDSSPEDQALARASLENAWQRHLGVPPESSGPSVILGIEYQSFTSIWLAAILAQFEQGDRALECLDFYLAHCVLDSGLGTIMMRENVPRAFSIGHQVGLTAAVNEMLLQGHHGLIRVFPALPAAWKEAAFHSLRCEGPFLVSSELKGGQVQYVVVRALTSGTCRLRDPFVGRSVVVTQQGQTRPLLVLPVQRAGAEIRFPVKRGDTYLIKCAD